MAEKRLKGVGGWLLFLVIILVFISPIYSFLDVASNSENYQSVSGGLYYPSIIFFLVNHRGAQRDNDNHAFDKHLPASGNSGKIDNIHDQT